MKSAVLITLIFSFLISCAITNGNVVSLNNRNFDTIVFNSSIPVVVKFYAPWCGHCKNLAPIYENAAKRLKDFATFAEVDCTIETSLAQRYNIPGYPTIKLFKPGDKRPIDYNDQRTINAIANFVYSTFDNKIHIIEDNCDKFWQESPELPHILLFSSKSRPSVLFKALASKFRAGAIFGYVMNTNKKLVEEFEVDSFPSLFILKSQNEKFIKYSNELSLPALENFLNSNGVHLIPHTEARSSVNGAQEKRIRHRIVPAEWKSIDFEELMNDKNVRIALILLDGSIDSAEAQSLLSTYGKERSFQFFSLDSKQAALLRENLKLNEKVPISPGFVVYNVKRGRYALAHKFDLENLNNLLDRVIGGDIKWSIIG